MEIFELRYFAAVADVENIHKASEQLNVSASALSKAIGRLEDELRVDLFEKDGRNIKLSSQGRVLHEKCRQFFSLEMETKAAVSGTDAQIEFKLAGPELFLSLYGLNQVREWKKNFAQANFEFETCSESDAQQAVLDRAVHAAIITEPKNKLPGLKYSQIERVNFKTFVSENHELASRRKPISVEELLTFDFLAPAEELLGKVKTESADGWRDDKLTRKLRYKNVGLKTIEVLTLAGEAVAYLPESLGKSLGLKALTLSGCPYSCEQKIVLVQRTK